MRQLALASVLFVVAGCYEMHGRPGDRDAGGLPLPTPRRDGGASPDVGTCEPVRVPGDLMCPSSIAVGDHLSVRARVEAPGCCGSEGAHLLVDGALPDVVLTAVWTTCTCCFDCECVTPDADIGVDLGVVSVPGTIRVTLDEETCEIEVLPPMTCEAIDEEAIIVPAVRLVGETIPVLVTTDTGHGCGCRPRARLADREGFGPDFVLEACDCSHEDPCVDSGYQATFIAAPSTEPEQRQFYQSHRAVVDVRRPEACGSVPVGGTVEIDALRVIAPTDRHTSAGDVWLEIQGHDIRCCGTPAIAVVGADEPDTYGLMECQFDLCDCAEGHRVDFTTYHHLGTIGGERRVVRVHDRDIVVDL